MPARKLAKQLSASILYPVLATLGAALLLVLLYLLLKLAYPGTSADWIKWPAGALSIVLTVIWTVYLLGAGGSQDASDAWTRQAENAWRKVRESCRDVDENPHGLPWIAVLGAQAKAILQVANFETLATVPGGALLRSPLYQAGEAGSMRVLAVWVESTAADGERLLSFVSQQTAMSSVLLHAPIDGLGSESFLGQALQTRLPIDLLCDCTRFAKAATLLESIPFAGCVFAGAQAESVFETVWREAVLALGREPLARALGLVEISEKKADLLGLTRKLVRLREGILTSTSALLHVEQFFRRVATYAEQSSRPRSRFQTAVVWGAAFGCFFATLLISSLVSRELRSLWEVWDRAQQLVKAVETSNHDVSLISPQRGAELDSSLTIALGADKLVKQRLDELVGTEDPTIKVLVKDLKEKVARNHHCRSYQRLIKPVIGDVGTPLYRRLDSQTPTDFDSLKFAGILQSQCHNQAIPTAELAKYLTDTLWNASSLVNRDYLYSRIVEFLDAYYLGKPDKRKYPSVGVDPGKLKAAVDRYVQGNPSKVILDIMVSELGLQGEVIGGFQILTNKKEIPAPFSTASCLKLSSQKSEKSGKIPWISCAIQPSTNVDQPIEPANVDQLRKPAMEAYFQTSSKRIWGDWMKGFGITASPRDEEVVQAVTRLSSLTADLRHLLSKMGPGTGLSERDGADLCRAAQRSFTQAITPDSPSVTQYILALEAAKQQLEAVAKPGPVDKQLLTQLRKGALPKLTESRQTFIKALQAIWPIEEATGSLSAAELAERDPVHKLNMALAWFEDELWGVVTRQLKLVVDQQWAVVYDQWKLKSDEPARKEEIKNFEASRTAMLLSLQGFQNGSLAPFFDNPERCTPTLLGNGAPPTRTVACHEACQLVRDRISAVKSWQPPTFSTPTLNVLDQGGCGVAAIESASVEFHEIGKQYSYSVTAAKTKTHPADVADRSPGVRITLNWREGKIPDGESSELRWLNMEDFMRAAAVYDKPSRPNRLKTMPDGSRERIWLEVRLNTCGRRLIILADRGMVEPYLDPGVLVPSWLRPSFLHRDTDAGWEMNCPPSTPSTVK